MLLQIGVQVGLLLLIVRMLPRVYLPKKCATAGGLAKAVLILNSEKLLREMPPGSESQVWELLVTLIEHQLGIPKDQINPDSQFLEDLRVD